jgi:hypothetical protein
MSTDRDLTNEEWLALFFVGGRMNPEKSRAMEQRRYGDPSHGIKMAGEELMQGTKEIENTLRYELENWIRWALGRSHYPPSFKCPLGYLYKSEEYREAPRPRVDDISAAAFEKIVVGLPERHRQAFVMHHLNRAASHGRVKILKGRDEGARLLGVQVRQYHYIVNQAHAMVLRRVQGGP